MTQQKHSCIQSVQKSEADCLKTVQSPIDNYNEKTPSPESGNGENVNGKTVLLSRVNQSIAEELIALMSNKKACLFLFCQMMFYNCPWTA